MTETKELTVVYETPKGEITLTPAIIKKYLVRGSADKITDQEIAFAMQLCKFQQLNPWLNEVYIIKYGSAPATLVTGIEAFLKRATRDKRFKGHRVSCSGKVPDLTATAEVFVEGYEIPVTVEVEYNEYVGKKGTGEVNSMWAGKPKTMLKKVALCQALRQAFPENLGGLYVEEEQGEGMDNRPPTNADKLMGAYGKGAETDIEPAAEETVDTQHPSEPPTPLVDTSEAPAPDNLPQQGTELEESTQQSTEPSPVLITSAQFKKLQATFTSKGITKREDKLKWINDLTGLGIESSKELTKDQARYIIEELEMS